MNRSTRRTGVVRLSWASAIAAVVAVAASCGPPAEEAVVVVTDAPAATATSDGACTPGVTQACLGPGACNGAQVCLPDGAGFGDCDCGEVTKSDAPGTTTTSQPDSSTPDPNDSGNGSDSEPEPEPQPEPEPEPEPDPSGQNDMCPNRDSVNWPVNARVIVDSVDWSNDRIVLRNVTSTDISLENWAVHLGQTLLTLHFVSGFTVPANGTFHVHLTESGTNTATAAYWAGTDPEFNLGYASGDISVHNNVDALDSPAALEAYVRWGADPPYPDQHHRDEAASAGFWTNSAGSYVDTSATDLGILSIGDVTRPTGYLGASGTCMP